MSTDLNKPELLLTPGPLTTSTDVRAAMQKDWGSWDADFRALTHTMRSELLSIAGDTLGRYDCVPIQGSGTFVVEAMLGAFVPKQGKALVLSNGAYGLRIARTLEYLGRDFHLLDKGDYLPPRATEVDQLLKADPKITHVVLVHCETSTGILNPLQEIADCVAANQRKFLIDALLKERGYIIYLGKLTVTDSFRMGCIGDFGEEVMRGAAAAAAEALEVMGVQQAAPSSAAREVQQALGTS